MFSLTDNEDSFEGRREPIKPYTKPQTVLHVPLKAMELTISMLRQYVRLESACFWYGLRDSAENGIVKAVVAPLQANRWGNYQISSASVSAMSAATSSAGWVCLAQVHSHPGSFVEHSSYDDEHASSQRILSIVIPNYGRWCGRWPIGIGVHECQNDYWYQLSDADAATRVHLKSGAVHVTFIDLRK
jgi:hypothetical protein